MLELDVRNFISNIINTKTSITKVQEIIINPQKSWSTLSRRVSHTEIDKSKQNMKESKALKTTIKTLDPFRRSRHRYDPPPNTYKRRKRVQEEGSNLLHS